MNILHVIRDLAPETGGPVSALYGLVEAQAHDGHLVNVITTDYGVSEPLFCCDNVTITLCRCTLDEWRYSPAMKTILTGLIEAADMIHIHTVWEYPTLIASRLAIKYHKPCILRPCGMLDGWSMDQSSFKKKIYLQLFSRFLFHPKLLLHFTAEGEKEKSYFPNYLKSFVMPNGLPLKAFGDRSTAAEFYKNFPSLKGKRIVLFLGRVDPKKQPDVAICAFSTIAPSDQDLHLVIAGPCNNESYRDSLSKLADKLGVLRRITFTGMLQGAVLYAAYRAAEVYVLPSLQENFGNTVAEAMAGSCPVVISDQVDIKNYIDDKNVGVICGTGHVSVSKALNDILSNPHKGRQMGENGRVLVENNFTWPQVSEKLERVYREIIGKF